MNKKLMTLGFVAAASLALVGCETANTNKATTGNANTAAMVNSSTVNSNSISPITTTNGNTMMNGNSNMGTTKSNINYNGSAKDNESQRTSIEAEAKSAGANIGQGAEDWWIWSKTRAALTANTTLKSSTGINVDVNNSVITLRGTVTDKADVAEADKIAKGINGQKGVQNKLTVGAGGTTTDSKAPAKKG